MPGRDGFNGWSYFDVNNFRLDRRVIYLLVRCVNKKQQNCYEYHVFLNQVWFIIQISIMKWLILLAVLTVSINTVDEGDWVDPFVLPIGFSVRGFFAGYLRIGMNRALYYVYTPSQSNPSKDPLVILLSPGPGCSSLHSWLYSKGQFTFTRNTTNFRHNPHNWNKQANVLYIEGPVGVGYSYGEESLIDDNTTQRDYFIAILRFYEKFPQLKDQPMYLAGFGYAGITAPKLILNIIQHNRDPNTPAWIRINVNGLLLFNPCTFADQCATEYNSYTVKALRDHFFISKTVYEDYRTHCTLRTSKCSEVEQRIQSDFKITGSDLLNIYQECLHQPGDYGCIDHLGIDIFLNLDTVKEDLNADKDRTWNLCNATISKNYKRDPDGSLKTYETLLREQHNLRVWIVSGTQSARVPTWGTKRWVDELKLNMGLPNIRLWQPWFYNTINAGDIEQIPGLTLLSIRSAGYLMFQDQPEISQHVFQSFLKGTRL